MDFSLKNMLGSFGKSSQSVVGIDIGSSSIKVVQLKKKGGRAILETYGELALGPYSGLEVGRATNLPGNKIGEALNDLLREANVTTKLGGMAIPIASSMVSLIEMPSLDQKLLAQMIPIEARKYIPVPISEVALDWWIIPQDKSKSSYIGGDNKQLEQGRMIDVLLVVILNEALHKYQEIVKMASLDMSFFEIEIFSTMRAVLDQDIQPVMIFDMGAASTKLYITERGIIRASHTINRGSQDITLAISHALTIPVADAERMKRDVGLTGVAESKNMSIVAETILQYTFSEANRVLLNFEKKYNKNVSKVVLTGGGVTLKGFYDVAKNSFQTEIFLGNPFAKVETPAFLEEILKQAGPEFAVAVGVALRRLQEFS